MFGMEDMVLAHTIENTHILSSDKNVTTLTMLEKKAVLPDISQLIRNRLSNIQITDSNDTLAREDKKLSIYFKFDSHKLSKQNELASSDLELQDAKLISINGFASSPGTKKYNIILSNKRIKSVASYIKAKGFKGEFFNVPYGEEGCSKKTKADRKRCQRTDIKISY